MVELPEGKDARDFAQECNNDEGHWTGDKWGAAGCVADNSGKELELLDAGEQWFVFFGWASE